MSARRRIPFGSGGDSERAAATPALAELRSELLVMPREQLAEDHVDMMLFEAQLLSTPRFAKTRAALPRPRRAAFVMLAVCGTLASCGLSAAGALPAPLQHITDSIARTLGVPQPHHTPPAPHAAASAPKPTTPTTAAVRPAPSTTIHHATATTSPASPKVTPRHVVTRPTTPPVVSTQSVSPPIAAKARPTVPPKRFKPRKPAKKPSNNSSNTPAGYPDNWRHLAAAATTAQLHTCALADTLSPPGCPQIASAANTNAVVQSVQWSLVTAAESEAVVVARVHPGGPNKAGPATTVTVYEPFAMGGLYTEAGTSHPYRAYSGGIAAATMTWNGKTFTNVTFTSGSAAGHELPGVTVPALRRPGNAPDSRLLAAVRQGFADCTAVSPDPAAPGPACALPAEASGAPWNVTGDPAQGAVVTFNADQGDFTVTGAYSLSSTGGTASGQYAATLFFDGQNVQVVGIAGS